MVVTGKDVTATEKPSPMIGTSAGITAAPWATCTALTVWHMRPVLSWRTRAVDLEWLLVPWRKKDLMDWTSNFNVHFKCIIAS